MYNNYKAAIDRLRDAYKQKDKQTHTKKRQMGRQTSRALDKRGVARKRKEITFNIKRRHNPRKIFSTKKAF